MAELSLLETLSKRAHCQYLSDLHALPSWDKICLAEAIEDIPSDTASLAQWNDTLNYLFGESPQPTPWAAR